MKNLQQAFAVGAAIFAGSTVFAGSMGPGNSQNGQAIALSNLNAAIVSGTINGFYAGGSNSPGFSGSGAPSFGGGGAPASFGGGFAPSAPSGPSSLLLPPSDPALLRIGTGGGTTNNSNSSNSNSNSSGSNGGSNSSNNGTGGGSSGPSAGGPTLFSALVGPSPQDVASVPDNGTAIAFLGAALSGLALLRRKFRV